MDSNIDHEFFNVGTNSSISILDLANMIIEYSGLELKPIFGPELKGDVKKTIANIDLIREKIGWVPTIMLEDWMKDIIIEKKFDAI